MKTIIATVALALATILGQAPAAEADKGDPPAPYNIDGPNADHRECVTEGEWGRIDTVARTKTDLNILLDGPGTKQAGNLIGVWYPICGKSPSKARVIVTYKPNKRGVLMLNLAFWMVFQGQGSGFRALDSVGA